MSDLRPVFFWDRGRFDDRWRNIVALTAIDHDPMVVVRGTENVDGEVAYRSSFSDGHLVVELLRSEFSEVPNMWYALLERPEGAPPNLVLVAFASGEFPNGTVVSQQEAERVGVSAEERVGAVQWGYGDPKIHQIFVHPDWRRRRISLALIGAADLVNMCGEWAGDRAIYGGDVTTDGGEKLREAWKNSPRVIPRQGIVHS